MPNFNGAIIVHALQLLNSPATLREIVVTIAKNTELPQDELKVPVKQTLEMGHRLGFLQKLDGRYFLVNMTFDTLMHEMRALDKEDIPEKPKSAKAKKIIAQKSLLMSEMEKITSTKSIKSLKPEKPKPSEKIRVQNITTISTHIKPTPSMMAKSKPIK
ncbi:uncharacterized protein LOC108118428 [Drosophila eugracilis]|uniref:uncharacterized protein LOC108118428 n=1 Tax=Drosophila eugracilis TaxID=29029 RepID=UPI001BDB4489|nr:uncharacterized protein LOC108118428 [Drosophila eugracilis]